jgi:hypothetical protein
LTRTIFGDGYSAHIEAHGQLFVLMAGEDLTIYRAYRSNGEVNLLPNSKTGKSLKVVQNYIAKFAG